MVTLPFFVCEVPHTRWKNKALGAGVGRGVGENEMADVATALVESSLAVCTCSLLHLLTTGIGTSRLKEDVRIHGWRVIGPPAALWRALT